MATSKSKLQKQMEIQGQALQQTIRWLFIATEQTTGYGLQECPSTGLQDESNNARGGVEAERDALGSKWQQWVF